MIPFDDHPSRNLDIDRIAESNPLQIVTELRNRHARGESHAGINVRRGSVTNMLEENVVQPLLVTSSALTLATECVRMILKVRRLFRHLYPTTEHCHRLVFAGSCMALAQRYCTVQDVSFQGWAAYHADEGMSSR